MGAAKLTSIPADTIRRIATDPGECSSDREHHQYQRDHLPLPPGPGLCRARRHCAPRAGANVTPAANVINGLLGATDVPGGLTGESLRKPCPSPALMAQWSPTRDLSRDHLPGPQGL